MNKANKIIIPTIAALMMQSCVKDTLFDTPHPDHGKITVTADWSDRGEGLDVPGEWNVVIGDYQGKETVGLHSPDYLFTAGAYTLLAWNTAAGISVNGSVATASYSLPGKATESITDNTPGWFHTHSQDVTIESDRDHLFTASMRQQVRQLTIVIKPQGDATRRITAVKASLGGVASTLDFSTNVHGNPVIVELPFRKSKDSDQWAATVRLLGVTGDAQKLTGTISFADGNPLPINFESDLSSELSDFNADKKMPLTLSGKIVATPMQTGVTATIKDWETLDDWNVDAF